MLRLRTAKLVRSAAAKLRRAAFLLSLVLLWSAAIALAQTGPRFLVRFRAGAHSQAVTGRVYVILAADQHPEPRLQIGNWVQQTPFFGVDVHQLKPGEPAAIDATTPGYPLRSLRDLPAGDYYVQALINIYTEFHRADGHVLWAHQDQWEGQQFNLSPGNLYSEARKIHLDPKSAQAIELNADQVIPPVAVPADTAWVKHIKIQSKLLTRFWGRPMFLGAVILLPRDYDRHPHSHYPAIYEQGHFSLDPPLFMRPDVESPDGKGDARAGHARRNPYVANGFAAWRGNGFPRFIAVTFQHPTPYFDDSYAVNSANGGPYGDAILTELIPYVEEHFRIIRQGWARLLTGGSTGGWEALALELYHPDFFGGTWSFFPDPIDFHRYQLTDIYEDDNAFRAPGFDHVPRERPMMRTEQGQVIETTRQLSQLEEVLGSHDRSGQQFDAWEAVYGPVGEDGYPQPLWDHQSGAIDRQVAFYMREHGYDLRDYAARNWSRIGPLVAARIHIFCGDMDNYYLNVAVDEMEVFLNGTVDPPADAEFQYGRPFKGHGWSPYTQTELVRRMAEFLRHHAPPGADLNSWNY